MIAADKYLMAIWQVAKPVEKVHCLALFSYHAEVAGVNHDVGLGQILQPMVRTVSV